MEASAAISAEGLSKKFASPLRRALWYGFTDIVREFVPSSNAPGLRNGEFWAVDGVSFRVGRGESLAVIGPNGAGKSTLLKMLSGVLKPDAGQVTILGRLGALIHLGTGFHPLLTGRENIRLAASLHGMSRREAEAFSRRVTEFSELGAALGDVVQSYSSGMKARLAYAVSTQIDPDLLLVDEVLAVGDFAFQRKCVGHMRSYLRRGGTLLLVSHNTHQIQAVCERAILLDHGRIAFAGTAIESLTRMFELKREPPESATASRTGSGITIEDLAVTPVAGAVIRTCEDLCLRLRYDAERPLDVIWGFEIWTEDQWLRVTSDFEMAGREIEAGKGELACVVRDLPLLPGRYLVRALVADRATQQPLAFHGHDRGGLPFDVRASADLLTNAQVHEGQLIKVHVDWI